LALVPRGIGGEDTVRRSVWQTVVYAECVVPRKEPTPPCPFAVLSPLEMRTGFRFPSPAPIPDGYRVSGRFGE